MKKGKRITFYFPEEDFEDIDIIRKAKEYARIEGIKFGKLIVNGLDYYLRKDNDIILKEKNK
ncbi:MAG: hypothetical protein QXY96_06665 [Candidatus Methanomethylicaceae archaeon]